MNVSVPNLRLHAPVARIAPPSLVDLGDDTARIERLRSLLSLLALYAAALLVVILVSDGADVGCILAGIAGHVLYASAKTALAWREASWLEATRQRLYRQRMRRA